MKEQLTYINPETDTLILDRGYFSYALFNELSEKGIHSVFRLKQDMHIVKNFLNGDSNDKICKLIHPDNNNIKRDIRLIKYNIGDIIYILGNH